MTTYTDIVLHDTSNNYFIPYGLINRLGDVNISNPTTGQNLTFDGTTGKWKNTSTTATVAWGGVTGNLSDQTDLTNALNGKQDSLVSGTNIKTINNTSLLGSGNISVPTSISDLTDDTATYPIDKAESLVDQNTGTAKVWTGTLAQYNAIVTKDADTIYNITDDQTASAYQAYTKSETDTLLNGKADIDLSNLSSTQSANFDGQYVYAGGIIADGVSVNGSTALEYTVSNLPNDGNKYWALILATVTTDSTSGNYAIANVGSSLMTNSTVLARIRTRTASTVESSGSCWIPVGSDRKIRLERSANWNGTVTLILRGYRRIGTNS